MTWIIYNSNSAYNPGNAKNFVLASFLVLKVNGKNVSFSNKPRNFVNFKSINSYKSELLFSQSFMSRLDEGNIIGTTW